MSQNKPLRFAIISSCPENWGGSEELWGGAAVNLAREGHQISVFKTYIDKEHHRIKLLESVGCKVYDLINFRFPLPFRLANRFLPYPYYYPEHKSRSILLIRQLKVFQPDLVVISQGENFDGMWYAEMIRKKGFPYVLISQKAVDFQWILDYQREVGRNVHQNALKTYFVSKHNHFLTEQQIGVRLPNAEVVRNPFLTKVDAALPFPKQTGLHLACVGRFWLLDKGQDILLRVLSLEKWKKRDLIISFYGEGLHQQALIELAEMLEVKNVVFAGHTKDVTAIWENNHALILPSRSEGLPLVLVEAMMCGRAGIATDVGGVSEVLEDGQTGFIADSPTDKAIDEVLERVWEKREDLEQMGLLAAKRIREQVPADPTDVFTKMLTKLANAL